MTVCREKLAVRLPEEWAIKADKYQGRQSGSIREEEEGRVVDSQRKEG